MMEEDTLHKACNPARVVSFHPPAWELVFSHLIEVKEAQQDVHLPAQGHTAVCGGMNLKLSYLQSSAPCPQACRSTSTPRAWTPQGLGTCVGRAVKAVGLGGDGPGVHSGTPP